MRRIRLGDAVRLLAPAAVYTGISAYALSDNWQWLGAGLMVGVVTTVCQANKLCDRLAAPDTDLDAVAEVAGVLRDPCGMVPYPDPPTTSMNPTARQPARAGDDVDLQRVFAELGPAFAALDRRANIARRGCTCGSGGAVATPRRTCPLHGAGAR